MLAEHVTLVHSTWFIILHWFRADISKNKIKVTKEVKAITTINFEINDVNLKLQPKESGIVDVVWLGAT